MSEATNTREMETEPGGENTQYESIKTVTKPPSKGTGQFSGSYAPDETQADKTAKGERTAANIRYGEAISEHGFGGETTGNTGAANQGSGVGGTGDDGDAAGGVAAGEQSRRVQGYGEGSGVGG